MGAGKLRTPLRVERRSPDASDPYGAAGGAFAVVAGLAEEWGKVTAKQGGEVSLAARLEGRQAYEVLVRRSPATETITAADKIVTRDDLALTLNVSSAAPYQADPRGYILITAEAGKTSG